MSHSKCKPNSIVFLENLSKVLAQNVGKDKIAKILQYGGKLVAAYATQSNPKSETGANAKRIESSAGSARKVFRLGNELSEYLKIRTLLSAPNPLEPLNILSLLRSMGMLFYFLFDHLVWLGNINAAKLDVQKHAWNSSVSWFIGLCATIILDTNSLMNLIRNEKNLKITYWRNDQNEDKSALHQQLQEILAKKKELYLSFVKNFADLAIAANLLKIKTLSPQRAGQFGLISAFIALYQLFPASR